MSAAFSCVRKLDGSRWLEAKLHISSSLSRLSDKFLAEDQVYGEHFTLEQNYANEMVV